LSKKKYDESSIQSLTFTEGIRKRPTMYIGSTGEKGFLHLIAEGADNSIDEFAAGYGKSIKISYDIATKKVVVSDKGRGIPFGKLEEIMCNTHTGGKFSDDSYKFSRGINVCAEI